MGKPNQGKATENANVKAIRPNISTRLELDIDSFSDGGAGFKPINKNEKMMPKLDNQYGIVWA
jgi:hypothetical protein